MYLAKCWFYAATLLCFHLGATLSFFAVKLWGLRASWCVIPARGVGVLHGLLRGEIRTAHARRAARARGHGRDDRGAARSRGRPPRRKKKVIAQKHKNTSGGHCPPDVFISKASQSSRLGSREKSEIRFCGGVYAAKNTLRGAECRSPPMAGQGAERSETLFLRVFMCSPG